MCCAGALCKFCDRLFFQASDELGCLVRILSLPVAERGERVHEVELRPAQAQFEVLVYGGRAPSQFFGCLFVRNDPITKDVGVELLQILYNHRVPNRFSLTV